MYQGLTTDLDLGLAANVGPDCSITAHNSPDHPPRFVFDGPSCNFELYFDPDALRAFAPIARKALTTMSPQAHPTTPIPPPANKHLSWAWINKGCYMDFIIASPESMYFRFGASANSFEPTFHLHALQTFVNLLNEVLPQLEPCTT